MEKEIKILDNVYLFNGLPAIYISDINSIVISDLQIGYEMYLAEKGIFIPQIQLEKMIKMLRKIKRIKKECKKIILNGDIKHEFGEASKQEWREVFELFAFLRKNFNEIILVRGNHDNYLLNILSKLNAKLYDPKYEELNYCFCHGHKKVETNKKILIIGHEQPAISLRYGFEKIKIPALLKGKYNNKTLLVLPAFSPISSGSEINIIEKNEFLSPYLQESDIEEFEVYGISEGLTLYFGKVKNLRFGQEIF